MNGCRIKEHGGVPEKGKPPAADEAGDEAVEQSDRLSLRCHAIAGKVVAKQFKSWPDDVSSFQNKDKRGQKQE